MKNTTEYDSAEVMAALMKYHKGRVPFDDKGFIAWPDNVNPWCVVTEEKVRVSVAKKGMGRVRVLVIKILEWALRRWGI